MTPTTVVNERLHQTFNSLPELQDYRQEKNTSPTPLNPLNPLKTLNRTKHKWLTKWQSTIDTPKTRELSLNKPTPFNGKQFKSIKFLQECILYMGINKDVYDTEPKRIVFMLSFMQEGNAVVWKQQFVQNKLNLDTGDIDLPTYKEFIDKFQKAFKPEEEDIDALDKLKML
ncbi:hypothetical protein CVT25_005366 [Psilocybe cyanescens]|uniref:DUF4939 domain-containing protein n=1 Tax=Psilocybe cyanescens TaxID=93625 RepID=A0A409XS26_PSICY|nr:hypothetical protein CVT25_005366 [Psilocybe cyanescens]